MPSSFRRPTVQIAVFGLLAFGLLTVRFSPNWIAFHREIRDLQISLSTPTQRAAVDQAIFSGYSVRGYYVTQLAHDLNAAIDDPNHKMARWRLLVPILGHVLHLPDWLILGLAHVGCLALILAFVGLAARKAEPPVPCLEPCFLGIVAGAGATFFTCMGLLGNYDSWLALALLGVAFASSRRLVLLACFVAPWIDERFVIGTPLALAVRRMMSEEETESRWAWFKEQALLPLLVVAGAALVRLRLGGSSGSQTVSQYLNQFVFAEPLSLSNRLLGAWEGLRFGWVLVAAALIGDGKLRAHDRRLETGLLRFGFALTVLLGLYVAQDVGRSMVLLVPLLPLGGLILTRMAWWRKFPAAICLAAAALIFPAQHVLGKFILPVDNFWSPSLALMTAQNNLGMLLKRGDQVPRNSEAAVRLFRRAAEGGLIEAQFNLGTMYFAGEGVARDSREAGNWFRKAAERGDADAQANLGAMYYLGEGVAKDAREAEKWMRKAAEQGNAEGQKNLGALYLQGTVLAKDLVQAYAWLSLASAKGQVDAERSLSIIEAEMTPEQKAAALNLARDLAKLAPTK